MGHDLTAGFALESSYLLGEVAAGNPGAGPLDSWQRLGEDDLGQLVHEVRVVASRIRRFYTPSSSTTAGLSRRHDVAVR
jgi:hypothetical protein